MRYLSILRQYWGYDDFRGIQREVIESIGAGRDTLGLMPTGGGKSITFQVPALSMEGLCLVVTPLISLMKDQVEALRRRNIRAAYINNNMSHEEVLTVLDNSIFGAYKFLYVSPERLSSSFFLGKLRRMKVCFVTVDEAHCICQWGYDFRPSYLGVSVIREVFPQCAVLALTATATSAVVDDIQQKLGFRERNVLKMSFERKNLAYVVRRVESVQDSLLHVLDSVPGSCIIYARNRRKCFEMAGQLEELGYSATYYHAGLPVVKRNENQERWRRGEKRIMVATNAFGMGINKNNVRAVIHYDMCDTPEAYYQEAGRAGRDGGRSYAVLLMDSNERAAALRRLESAFPPIDVVKQFYDKVCSGLKVAYGEGAGLSFAFNEYEFADRHRMNLSAVRNCFKLLATSGYMMLTDASEHSARIMFRVSREELYNFRQQHRDGDNVLLAILRLYEGVFSEFRPIDIEEIAHHAGCDEGVVKDVLRGLWQRHIVEYRPRLTTPMVCLLCDRVPERDVYIEPQMYRRRKDAARVRLEAMLEYASLPPEECRTSFFGRYFGAPEACECGVCDLCIDRKRGASVPRPLAEDIERTVLQLLDKHGSLPIARLQHLMATAPKNIAAVVEKLIAEEQISCDVGGNLTKNR